MARVWKKRVAATSRGERDGDISPFALALYRLGSMCLRAVRGTEASPPVRILGIKDQASDPIVLTVGKQKVHASELCGAIEWLSPPQRNGFISSAALAEGWYGPLVALAQEARGEHLDRSLQTRGMTDLDANSALSLALTEKMAREIQPTTAQIDTYYVAHKSQFAQVKVRHILVSDAAALASRSNVNSAQAKAKIEAIASQLGRGADFATLARENSDDLDSKAKGGDLGYISAHQMEPSFDSVVWSLAPGRTSAPFESRFGYEIVKVEGRRTLPLADVRESIIGNIKFQVLERKQQQIIVAGHIALMEPYSTEALPCALLSLPKAGASTK